MPKVYPLCQYLQSGSKKLFYFQKLGFSLPTKVIHEKDMLGLKLIA